jgi:hypothetical protein
VKFKVQAFDVNGKIIWIKLEDDHEVYQELTFDDVEALQGKEYTPVFEANASDGGNTKILNHGTFTTVVLDIDYTATFNTGTTIVTLPSGVRPSVPIAFVLYDSNGGQDVMATLFTDGTVKLEGALNTAGKASGSIVY